MKIGDRIKAARKERGLNQTELANISGAESHGTISRYERGERTPDLTTIENLAKALCVSPAWLVYGVTDALAEIDKNITPVEVIGAVQAGEWAEAMEWHVDDRYDVYVPVDPRHRHKRRFALEVRGQSMNKLYPEGTVLLCIQLDDETKLRSGQHVIIQRHSAGMIESTVKELVVTDAGRRELWPRSHDPLYQEPIRYDNGDADEVSIIGVVVGMYRLV